MSQVKRILENLTEPFMQLEVQEIWEDADIEGCENYYNKNFDDITDEEKEAYIDHLWELNNPDKLEII